MANDILNPSVIAKAAVRILDNELVMANRVYRDYESEFHKSVNGYKIGATVSIRKPAQFTIRTGSVASIQDVTEATTTLTINKVAGVDFQMGPTDLTLNISDLADRVIKPAMVRIANQIDTDVHSLFSNVPSWVGTPGNNISTFAGFMAGVQRMNEQLVPQDDRAAVLSPADQAALISTQAGLYVQDLAKSAYRQGVLPGLAGVDTYMTQNAPTLTTGSRTNGTVSGANQNTTYSGTTTNTQTLNVAGLGAAGTVAAGEVFTIAGVFAVNHVTKAVYPYLKQFVVTAAATADGAGAAALTISPPIVSSGAFQNCSATPANAAVITWKGTAATSYVQNQFFHRNAHALCVVPMEKPMGAVNVGRESYKGISVRLAPYWDGVNDINKWRFDVLYGLATIDHRLAVRVSGA